MPPKVYIIILSASPQSEGEVVSVWTKQSDAEQVASRAAKEWRKANLHWRVEEHELRTGQGS